jgi:serine/threonine protein kinase
MPVIEVKKQHKAETRYDFLDADEAGMVTHITRIETQKLLAEGDLSEVHICEFNGISAVAKVLRDKRDSDLADSEAATLLELCPDGKWHEEFNRYLPQLLLTEKSADWGTINIFPHYSDWITLDAVLRAYPDGIDFKDAVWMYKRTLITLGFAHGRGFVHGAAIPEHVLVHPVNHGGKLLDWSYATKLQKTGSKHLPAISTRNRAYYPPEVLEKRSVHPTLDIYMATKVMVSLIGGDLETNEMPDTVPQEVQTVLKKALVPDFRRRPQDAWDFHGELEEVLKRVVGPRKYREFVMPT